LVGVAKFVLVEPVQQFPIAFYDGSPLMASSLP
jgi:hypothetical protein